jgi:L-rhamnose isomerase
MSSSVSSTLEGLVKCVNIVPRIKALSADIIVWMVFGSDTEGVEDFKAEYIKYWEFLRIVKMILKK